MTKATFMILCAAFMLQGCDDPSKDQEPTETVAANDAPPLFEYHPGDPGRAVGVRAKIDMEGVALTSRPLEMALLSPGDGNAAVTDIPAPLLFEALPNIQTRTSAINSTPAVGEEVSAVGTVNGNVCYMVSMIAGGSFGASEYLSSMLIFAKEGMYKLGSHTEAVYYPPDWGNLSYTVGIGCAAGDQPTQMTADYLRSFSSYTITFSMFIYSAGYSAFVSPGRGFVRAFQYNTGTGITVSIFPFPVSISLSMDMQSEPVGPSGFRFIAPWPESVTGQGEGALPSMFDIASPVAATASDATRGPNALAYALQGMKAAAELGDDSYESVLTREIASQALPVLEEMGNPGEGGLAENVPAASNSDFMADFLNRTGTDLVENAPNTSPDALIEDLSEGLTAAGDDTYAIMDASASNQQKEALAVPSSLALSAMLSEAETALPIADELENWKAPESEAVERYVDPHIVYVDVNSGETAEVTLLASEAAALIGRPQEDVIGATILVNAGPDIVDQPFTLDGEELVLTFTVTSGSLLVKMDVDLSTAAGDFPAEAADWVIRPALRIIRTAAGAPNTAFISGPGQFASGAPATLSAGAIDENGRLIQRPFTAVFIDAEGNEIGSAEAKGGIARFQYIPQPTVPIITAATSTAVLLNDVEVPGFELAGTGFSVDASVTIGGRSLSAADEIGVLSPERIVVVLPDDISSGTYEVVVENPDGLASAPAELTL